MYQHVTVQRLVLKSVHHNVMFYNMSSSSHNVHTEVQSVTDTHNATRRTLYEIKMDVGTYM